LRSWSCFPTVSSEKKVDPVTFPPGLARLVTRPTPTGSATPTNTTGTVVVHFPGRQGGRRAPDREHHVHLASHEVRRKLGQSFVLLLRRPVLEDDVLAFDVAQLAEAVAEGVERRSRRGRRVRGEHTDPEYLPRLRARDAGPGEQAEAQSAEKYPAAHHCVNILTNLR